MSLTHDDLEDIKQLMESVVYQHGRVLKDELKTELKTELKAELMEAINARFDEQDDKLNEILNVVGADLAKHTAQLDDHEDRIKRLERKPA